MEEEEGSCAVVIEEVLVLSILLVPSIVLGASCCHLGDDLRGMLAGALA
jgi:hypothetical protein